MLAEQKLAKRSSKCREPEIGNSLLEALERRTLLSAHFPLGVPPIGNPNPFADSAHGQDPKSDSGGNSDRHGAFSEVQFAPPQFDEQPTFVADLNFVPLGIDSQRSSRTFTISTGGQPFQAINFTPPDDTQITTLAGSTGDSWNLTDLSSSSTTSNASPVTPITSGASSPVIIDSDGDAGQRYSYPPNQFISSRSGYAPTSAPPVINRVTPPPAPTSSAPVQAPTVPSPAVASTVIPLSSRTITTPTIRSENNAVLESSLSLSSPLGTVGVDLQGPTTLGQMTEINLGATAKSSAQKLADASTTDAALSLPQITLTMAYNRNVWNLGEGLSSIGTSAGMIETLLIADASALARVANSAADRIYLEEAMVWKEIAAFLGGGILIGTYAVRTRQTNEIAARGTVNRKTLCVGEFPAQTSPPRR